MTPPVDARRALEQALSDETLWSLVDRVARVMCELEVDATVPPTMEVKTDRVNRTWPRHRHEARCLIEALAKIGISVGEQPPPRPETGETRMREAIDVSLGEIDLAIRLLKGTQHIFEQVI